MQYIKTYLQIGIQNPKAYLLALKNMIVPYWDMSSNPQRHLCFTNTFQEYNTWGITKQSLLPTYYDLLYNATANMYYDKIPFISTLLNPGFCIWIITALTGIAIAYKKKNTLLGVLPIVLYFATLMLGPVALIRYIFPIMLTVPLMVGKMFLFDPKY